MRIDGHQHFWQIGRYEYPWMGVELGVIYRDFGPEDLRGLLENQGFDGSVLVQTISSVDETRWFLKLAGKYSFIAGVVGWVDLTDPEVGATLDELREDAKLVGIRHQVHDEPDDRWLLQEDVRRGLSEMAKRGVPYDLLIRPGHLDVAVRTAKGFPGLPLVVDHIAKPGIARHDWVEWGAWAEGIAELAECENVYCKLSGMITEADWKGWKAEDLRPYVDHVIESFGARRVLFGSDWPVCLLAGSYEQVVGAAEANLAGLSESERADVFGNNAVRFYGL
jgi:L-fuconolactonase